MYGKSIVFCYVNRPHVYYSVVLPPASLPAHEWQLRFEADSREDIKIVDTREITEEELQIHKQHMRTLVDEAAKQFRSKLAAEKTLEKEHDG